MSLLYCAECGHEISSVAVACPNCGHPINSSPPVVERKVVPPPVVRREAGFPTWAFIPLGVLAVVLLFLAYFMLRSSDDQANTNVNVNMARRNGNLVQDPARDIHTTSVPSTGPESVTVPSTTTTTTTLPSSVPSTSTTIPGTTTVPPVAPPPDKGSVVINARIESPRSGAQAARNAKFYLLDKDLETILSEARLQPIEGNSLTGSLGLAIVFPDRYGDFQRSAMRAIGGHVKYTGSTNGSGNANLSGVTPNEYYLFGITKVGRGFALWDSPVSVIPGQNVMNLSPQAVTEIPDMNG